MQACRSDKLRYLNLKLFAVMKRKEMKYQMMLRTAVTMAGAPPPPT